MYQPHKDILHCHHLNMGEKMECDYDLQESSLTLVVLTSGHI